MELEGLTDNEKDARIAELEAKLAEAKKDREHGAWERAAAAVLLTYISKKERDVLDLHHLLSHGVPRAHECPKVARVLERQSDDVYFDRSIIGVRHSSEEGYTIVIAAREEE